MITIENCPVCKHTDFKKLFSAKDFLVSGSEFDIQTCVHCGFKFTSPRPEDYALGEYYQSDEYVSHNDSGRGLVARLYRLVRRRTLQSKEKWIRRHNLPGTLLDYGCGTGHFISVCKEKGWQVFGIEPDKKAFKIAETTSGSVVRTSQDELEKALADKKLDVVSMWHVLEHISDLSACLDFLDRRLSANGTLYVAVPNINSRDAVHYGRDWAALDVPRHLYHFCEQDLKRLFESKGFQLKESIGMPYDSFYVSLLSERNQGSALAYLKAVCIGLYSNFRALFNSEYSSRVYVFRRA